MNERIPLPAIEALLPHQAPMLLLDHICTVDASQVRCETRVGPRHALLLDGEGNLPAWAGIELMAQTIAAWAGMQGRLRGEPVRIGMLLAAACCKTAAWPVLNAGSCKMGRSVPLRASRPISPHPANCPIC